MNKKEIKVAIKRTIDSSKITQYLKIMSRLPNTDVSVDVDFQRDFNALYKMGRKQQEWYREYFRFMQAEKNKRPTFLPVLTHLHSIFNRYEPSFASKFVASIDPEKPIWDKYVFINTRIMRPSYVSKNKAQEIIAAYDQLQHWYDKFMNSKEYETLLELFEDHVPEHEQISDIKKIDFVLWQMR